MKENQIGFYNQVGVPKEEIERLKNIEFPNLVSETILNNFDLSKKRILDVGSGSNGELGRYMVGRGGVYVAVDIRKEMLTQIKNSFELNSLPFFGVQADVAELPFVDNQFDFSHLRFVLMHLSPKNQRRAIEETVRVTKENIFIIDYNWRTLVSSTHSEEIKKFRKLSFELTEQSGVDPFLGEKIEELIKEATPNMTYRVQKFQRKEDDYTNELIALCEVSNKIAKARLNNPDLSEKFLSLSRELKINPVKFSPPEVVVAVIDKE